MKNFQKFLIFSLFLSLWTSCQQKETVVPMENIAANQALTIPDIDQLHADYIARHGRDVIVEHSSLEEMNALFVEHGMTPVTLEDLGLSQEEYDAAQVRIHSGEAPVFRCDEPIYQFLGDMNDDGMLSNFDIILAQRVILLFDPPSTNSYYFGWLSFYWNGISSALTTFDAVVTTNVVLDNPCP